VLNRRSHAERSREYVRGRSTCESRHAGR
jgi:hypothetical protein